jgi:hypothetical protein
VPESAIDIDVVSQKVSIPMVSPISLSGQVQRDLRLQARRTVGRISERIHFVLLFARGLSVSQIASLYAYDERTISEWITRYQQDGLAGLNDHPDLDGRA